MDLIQRTEKLIQSLKCPKTQKDELLNLLSKTGVHEELVRKIEQVISKSEEEYLAKAEGEVEAFKKAYNDLKKELDQIIQNDKLEKRTKQKQKDAEEIKVLLQKIQSEKN